MSCFIHTDKTYSKILWTLYRGSNHELWKAYNLEHCIDDIDYKSGETVEWQTLFSFIEKMKDFNIQACCERYKKTYDPSCQPFECSNESVLTITELYKILSSVNYQCIDSSNYCNSDFERAVEGLIARCASEIISKTPAYEQAAWG